MREHREREKLCMSGFLSVSFIQRRCVFVTPSGSGKQLVPVSVDVNNALTEHYRLNHNWANDMYKCP